MRARPLGGRWQPPRGLRWSGLWWAAALALGVAPAARADDGDEPAGDPLAVHIRTIVPRVSPWGDQLVKVAARIKRDTLTAIAPRLDWDQKSEVALVKQCKDGKVAGILVSFAALSTAVPELGALDLPFLFDDYADADRAMKAAEPLIKQLMQDQGLVFGMRVELGFRHFATKPRAAIAPADFAGLALRQLPSEVGRETLQTLGAQPVTTGLGEVTDALQKGTIAGYDQSLFLARALGWSAGIAHVTLSAHAYQGAVLTWCKPWLDRLQPELRSALERHDKALEASGLALVRTFNDDFMPRAYKGDGVELHALGRDEREALRAALTAVGQEWRAGASAAGLELLDRLEKRR